jgi:hypothetical protein
MAAIRDRSKVLLHLSCKTGGLSDINKLYIHN